MNKLVETILLYIPLSVVLFFAGVYLGGEIWCIDPLNNRTQL